jgi:hypothetical protein
MREVIKMIRAIIETIACLFYPETMYLIFKKKINVFTVTGNEFKKMLSEQDKKEFLQHIKDDNRRQLWEEFLED